MTEAKDGNAERGEVVGAVTVRKDDKGNFDELFGHGVDIHMEMMSDSTMWVGIDSHDGTRRTMIMMMAGKRLGVSVQDDSDD